MLALSVISCSAAALTLSLVWHDGARVPPCMPFVGGRQPPPPVIVGASLAGATVVTYICIMSVLNWNQVSGFADQPGSGWANVMAACYAPALLWAPLLLAVTADYRRRAGSQGRR